MLKKNIILACLLLFVSASFAQKTPQDNQKTALKTILLGIEKQYNVRFSYSSSLIKKFTCSPLTSESTLVEKLKNLATQTNLNFKQLDNRYVAINEKKVVYINEICGILKDLNTQKPLAFAAVIIDNTLRGTTTDSDGFFKLNKVSSNQQLIFNSIGYKKEVIPVFRFINKPCLNLQLGEENFELEEVLISDYITQGISKKQNGGIGVSPAKLGILPGMIEPDVLLSLQLLPGIQSASETASGLQIRGSSPDQNLILFDGIKMFQSGHFFGLISSFNPYVTKKINLFRSGTRAKFGERIGGVLDISSGEDVPDFEAGVGLNLTHADAYIKTPLFNDKIGLVFSARRSITDVVETITYKNFSETVFQNTRILADLNQEVNKLSSVNNDFYFKDYNIKLVANISKKDKLSISNLYNRNQLEYSSKNDRFRESVVDNIAYQNKGTRIGWTRNSSKKIVQSLDLHTSSYKFDYFGKRIQTRNNPNENGDKEFTVKNYVDDLGLNYGFTYNYSDNLALSGGYQYSKTKTYYLFQNNFIAQENLFLSDENSTNTTNAFFSELRVNKPSNYFVSFGIRANRFTSAKEWFFEPRLFASKLISDNLSLKISGEIKNQAVSQIIEYRNNGIGLENNVWAVANQTIPILNSNQISFGFLYQNNGWNLDVDFYKKKIKGQTLMTDDLANQTPFYVFGESDINGIDLLLKKRFGSYRSWISYTYNNISQKFKDINNNNSFNGMNEVPHSFTWSHTYKLNQFEFSLGWKMRSGIPYTSASKTFIDNRNNLRIQYDEVNAKRLPNYQKVDFSSTYKFSVSKKNNIEGKLGLSLLNVFNSKNILARTYELKFINNSGNIEKQILVEKDKISLGFTPNVVFRLTF